MGIQPWRIKRVLVASRMGSSQRVAILEVCCLPKSIPPQSQELYMPKFATVKG